MTIYVDWLWPRFDRGEAKTLLLEGLGGKVTLPLYGGIDYGLILRQLERWATARDSTDEARHSLGGALNELIEAGRVEEACRLIRSYATRITEVGPRYFMEPVDVVAMLDRIVPGQGTSSDGVPLPLLVANTRRMLDEAIGET